MIIGITGGIGTGKSTVLKILNEKFGFSIFEADKIAHELMSKGNAVYDRIVNEFGNDILKSDGEIDRKVMSSLVFNNKSRLETINNIVHPAVIDEIKNRIERENKLNGTDKFVVEAALLIESGCGKICDKIWYIYSDDSIRIERLKSGRGMEEDAIKAVIKNQLNYEDFEDKTDAMIDNSFSIDNTISQIKKLLEF